MPVMRALLLLFLAFFAACGEGEPAASPKGGAAARSLPRVRAYRLPDDLVQVRMDGNGADVGWRRATEQKITLQGDAEHGPTDVTIKAIYHDKAVYFLLMWRDESATMETLCRFEKPGQWKVHEREDAAMLLFAPGNVDAEFRAHGFDWYVKNGAFHSQAKEGFADAWYWGCQTTRSLHQARDHWIRPNQRLRGDSQPEGSDNVVNWASTHDGPAAVPRKTGGRAVSVLPIKDSIALTKQRMDLMKAESNFGWTVPAVLSRRMLGSRGDVHASARHVGGGWVLEIARKLDTGNRDDLVHGDPLRPSLFAIAIWNATARGIRPGEYGLECTRSGAIELEFVSES